MPDNLAPALGDSTNVLLRKLVGIFNGSADGLDSTNALVRKLALLAYGAYASGGSYYTSTEVDAAIQAARLKDFQDGNSGDARIYSNDGATEQLRVKSTTGYLEFVHDGANDRKQILTTSHDVRLDVLASANTRQGAFLSLYGMTNASANGSASITTIGRDSASQGMFSVLNAPGNSISSTTRMEMQWWGDWRLVPNWTDATRTYAGLKLDITNTASASASKAFDIHVGGATKYSVDPAGIATSKNDVYTVSQITYNANVALDFTGAAYQYVDLTGDITFTSANLGAGRTITVKILADGSARNLSFPGTWQFLGTIPASIAANKTAILSATSFSNSDALVVAAYSVEA